MAVSTLPLSKSPCVVNANPVVTSGPYHLKVPFFDRGGDKGYVVRGKVVGRSFYVPATLVLLARGTGVG